MGSIFCKEGCIVVSPRNRKTARMPCFLQPLLKGKSQANFLIRNRAQNVLNMYYFVCLKETKNINNDSFAFMNNKDEDAPIQEWLTLAITRADSVKHQ